MAFQSYKDLLVWQTSMDFVIDVYDVIAKFPAEEKYALYDQLRRAVVSIPSNISEGHGRTPKDFYHFLSIAQGSLNEVGTQLEIALRLNYFSIEEYRRLEEQIHAISKMLCGLRNSIGV